MTLAMNQYLQLIVNSYVIQALFMNVRTNIDPVINILHAVCIIHRKLRQSYNYTYLTYIFTYSVVWHVLQRGYIQHLSIYIFLLYDSLNYWAHRLRAAS